MAPIMTERPEFPSAASSASEILCEDGPYMLPKQPPSPGLSPTTATSPSSSSSSLSVAVCEPSTGGPVTGPVTGPVSGGGGASTTASILATMDTFVRVIDEMHDTILIPSKLRDMELDGGHANTTTSSNVMALVPQQQGSTTTATSQPPPDLLAYYNTLSAIKTELVNGQSSEDDDDSDSDSDSDAGKEEREKEPAFQAAAAFRHHLQGLFGVLQQLTGTAKLLTTRYQEEIGEAGPATAPAAFTL